MFKKVKNPRFLMIILIMAVCFFSLLPGLSIVQGAAPGAPTGLLTEYVANPLGIDTLVPGFSWTVNDPDRGEIQSAYQIIVASSLANINSNTGDKWDSGKVTSTQSTGVKYAGSALSSNTRYWWKIKTWDKDNTISAYTNAGSFDVGLLSGDWTASHIWDGTTNVNNFAYFRKKFTIAKTVSLAKIYLSAHDDYKLYINGTEIGRGPARSNPYKRMLYNSYDITSNLVTGDNVIAVIGHYHGIYQSAGTSAVPSLILEARIKFTDATALTVKTDATWKTKAATPWKESPYTYLGASYSQSRCVENYDARLEIPGWQGVSYNDSSWLAATVVDRSNYTLKAQYVALDHVQQILDPISINSSSGAWVVDFGKCINGWPKLTMTGNASGSVVTVRYAETPNAYSDYDTYTCKGGGAETWEPDIAHESFRCLKIEGYTGTLTAANIKGMWKYTDAVKTGNFNSSSTLFNDIYTVCERSARQNIQQGMVSVDAWREQSSYTADAYILGMNSIYNHQNSLVVRKTIQDYASEQLASGNLRSRSPSTALQEIPEWTLHWVFMLWLQYLHFNDRDILTENYPVLQNVLNFFNTYRNSTTNLLTDTSGWEISDYPNGGYIDQSGSALTAQNCQYYRALRIAADVATVLGYSTDAAGYATTAANVKNGINTHLFDGVEKYRDCSGSSQYHCLSSCWPLIFDLVPEDKKQAVLNYVKSKGFEPQVYGGTWFCDTLYQFDQGLHMYNLLNQPDERWGKMLDTNSSLACWEDWTGKTYNHAWSSYPAKFMLSGLMGIYPTGAGFSTFDLRPRVEGGLTFGEATVPTVKGPITCRWDKLAGNTGLTMNATVPVNTTARVCIPKQTYINIFIKEGTTTIWNNGTYTGGVTGVTYDGEEAAYVRFSVGSGSYSFTLTGTYVGPTATPTPTLTPTPDPNNIIVDNDSVNCTRTGTWTRNTGNEVEQRYLDSFHHSAAGDGSSYANFTPNITTSGNYQVYAWWTSHSNRATNAPYTIYYNGGSQTVTVNQETGGGQWNLLGTFNFAAGTSGYVKLSNNANEYVIADAVRFLLDSGATPTPTPTPTATATSTPVSGYTQAPRAGATASSSVNNSFLPANIIDGNNATAWSSAATGGETGTPQWIYFDMGSSYSIVRARLFPRSYQGVYYCFPVDFKFQYSADSIAWTDVPGQSYTGYSNPSTEQFFIFGSPVVARYLRLYTTRFRTDQYNTYYVQLAEFNADYSSGNTPAPTATPTPTGTPTPIPTSVNLALNKTVTASSSYESNGWFKAKAVDGQRNAISGAYGWTSNNSLTTNHTEWVTVDLGTSYSISKVDLYPRNDGVNTGYGFPVDFTIQVSIDNTNWTTVVTRTGYALPPGTVQSFTFTSRNARYIKIEGTALRQNPNDNNQYRMQFAEIEVY